MRTSSGFRVKGGKEGAQKFARSLIYILQRGSTYVDKDGKQCRAEVLHRLRGELRMAGWRNVSRLDYDDFERMGCMIVHASYYCTWRKPSKRLVRVIALPWCPMPVARVI